MSIFKTSKRKALEAEVKLLRERLAAEQRRRFTDQDILDMQEQLRKEREMREMQEELDRG